MRRSYLLLSAVALAGVVAFAPTSHVSAGFGDVDGSTQVSISDSVYIINYLGAGGPAPDFAADADDYDLITIRDLEYLVMYIFSGGVAPVCPPSHGKYTPAFYAEFNLTYSAVFPANETQYSFEVRYQNSFDKEVLAPTVGVDLAPARDEPAGSLNSGDRKGRPYNLDLCHFRKGGKKRQERQAPDVRNELNFHPSGGNGYL